MLPPFTAEGNLPPGLHAATWTQLAVRFGGTPHRERLLSGLRLALIALAEAGCQTVYVDGSFVTAKEVPGDYDGCWDIAGVDASKLDPVFLDFSNGRATQKEKFLGEFFVVQMVEGGSGLTFLDFFQADKRTGQPNHKGIVVIDPRSAL